MKKALVLLLLLSFAFADFQLQNLEVSIKMNDNGSAIVEERINLIVFGDYGKQLYDAALNKNTLSDWQVLTNISEIKTHISRKGDIKDLVVRPQPLRRSLSASGVWYGQIIIDYSVSPYYDKDGNPIKNTGIFNIERYKPRVTRYVLNNNAFNFPRSETGDIKLSDETMLSITPPPNSIITYVNPISTELSNERLPMRAKTLSWSGLNLVQFSLKYEIEQSLDKEVLEFFSELQNKIRSSLLSTEGIAATVLIAILILSYLYLKLSRR